MNIQPYRYYRFSLPVVLSDEKRELNKAKSHIILEILIKSNATNEWLVEHMPTLLPTKVMEDKIYELYDRFIEGGAKRSVHEDYTYGAIPWKFELFVELDTGELKVGIFGKVTKKEE